MTGLIDGLILYLNFGQIGDYCRLLFDNFLKYTNYNLNIVKDYEIKSNKYINNSIELLIDRKNDNSDALINYMKSTNINFFHCLNNGFSIPKNYNFNYIISISNLMPLYIEELCNQDYLFKFFNKFPYSILSSENIVCPSRSCKTDLLNKFSMNSEKIIVNYGVLSDFFTPQDKFISSIYINSKFDINEQYIFFYGDFHKRKNLEQIIDIFMDIKKIVKNITLVIGTNSFRDREYLNSLENLIRRFNMIDSIFLLENLNELDLLYLLNNAFFL